MLKMPPILLLELMLQVSAPMLRRDGLSGSVSQFSVMDKTYMAASQFVDAAAGRQGRECQDAATG